MHTRFEHSPGVMHTATCCTTRSSRNRQSC
jgi:HD superfamily phosphohydrolase